MSERKPCVVGKCKKEAKYGNLPFILLMLGIVLIIFGFVFGFTYSLVIIAPPFFILIPTIWGYIGFIVAIAGIVILIVGIVLLSLAKQVK